MPNRVLYSTLLTSAKVNRLDSFDFELYIRLLLVADDFGRYSGSPVRIARSCWPDREDVTSKKVIPILQTLSKVGLIVTYTVDDEPYLEVTGWHQRSRQTESKFPSPDDGLPTYGGHMTGNAGHMPALDVDVDVDVDGDVRRKTVNRTTPKTNVLNVEVMNLTPDLKEIMIQFIDHRKEMKSPLTQNALELSVKKLQRICNGNESLMIATAEDAIASGWKSFYLHENNGKKMSNAERALIV